MLLHGENISENWAKQEIRYPRAELYVDETWVDLNEAIKQCWSTGDGAAEPRLKTRKVEGLVVVHAGGSDGCVPDGLQMFPFPSGKKEDCHDSMNYD